MACPNCNSSNVRRTQRGLLYDEYVCKLCTHEFTALNKRNVMRFALTGVSVFTGGICLDVFGSAADAADLASDASDLADNADDLADSASRN